MTTISILDSTGTAQAIAYYNDSLSQKVFGQMILANGAPVTTAAPMPVSVTSNTPANKSALNGTTTTLAPSAFAYTAGLVIGGGATIANAVSVNGGSATLNRVKVVLSTSGIAQQIDVYIFSAPLTGTYTDQAIFNLNATDAGNLITVANITSNWPANGTGPSVGLSEPILAAMQNTNATTNLYIVPVVRTGFTLGASPTMTVSLNATPL